MATLVNGEPQAPAQTENDRRTLALTDEEFKLYTWDNLKDIIAHNDLSLLKRKPSDLQRYEQWTKDIKATYGSMTTFILQERLHWTPLPSSPSSSSRGPTFDTTSPTPFADSSDYKILYNDWPYGMAPGITHLVVWLKNRIEVEGEQGQMTPHSRALVEGFVDRVFRERVGDEVAGREEEKAGDGGGNEGAEKVMWFRNWAGLQSVRGLDHVHVLVRDVERSVLEEWVGGKG